MRHLKLQMMKKKFKYGKPLTKDEMKKLFKGKKLTFVEIKLDDNGEAYGEEILINKTNK